MIAKLVYDMFWLQYWLVVEPPIRRILHSHLGWWFPIYEKENLFQTSNRLWYLTGKVERNSWDFIGIHGIWMGFSGIWVGFYGIREGFNGMLSWSRQGCFSQIGSQQTLFESSKIISDFSTTQKDAKKCLQDGIDRWYSCVCVYVCVYINIEIS